jgi:hypothetical protein
MGDKYIPGGFDRRITVFYDGDAKPGESLTPAARGSDVEYEFRDLPGT